MKRIKLLFVITLLCISNSIKSQETIKVMYYNLLNFPLVSQTRADTLKKIVQHVLPDIFVVNELTSQFGATLILNNALNQNGITHYQQATFVNGPDTDNLLFYNSTKLGLVSQNEIATALRDINEYVLYYKDPNLSASSDTVKLFVYSCHLKASSTAPNPSYRLAEVQILKNYLSSRAGLENVLVGGDFNFYGSTISGEPAVDEILNGGSVALFDPINSIGQWHVNSFYANIHTQSTRTTSFDGGSTGGLDDRFDFIFISDEVQTGWKGAKYVANSYRAIGQDGVHYNGSLVSPLSNGDVPDNIANALHQMSDHLPVYMELTVGGPLSITENTFVSNFNYNSSTKEFEVFMGKDFNNTSLVVYDLTGKQVLNQYYSSVNHIQTSFSNLKSGIYIVTVSNGKEQTSMKIAVI